MQRMRIQGKLPPPKPRRGVMPTRLEPDRKKEARKTACRGRESGHEAFQGLAR